MTIMVETLNRRVARESAHRAWRTIRASFWALLFTTGLMLTGSCLEGLVAPPIQSQSTSNAHTTEDGRLCWDWRYYKRLGVVPIAAYAELYVDEEALPIFVGLENGDGRPFAAAYASRPGKYAFVETCLHIPKSLHPTSRFGVQGHLIYRSNPLWTLPVNMQWVDYYVPRPPLSASVYP